MPNPIIANIRSGDDEKDGIVRSSSDFPPGVKIRFYSDADSAQVMYAIETGGNATVLLGEEATAWIVDGQHRSGAVKLLRDRKRLDDDFPVPIKIMLGFQRAEEITQFYYINSQAKNVPTDLTAELLQRMARQDSGEAEYLSERKNKSNLLAGAAVYDALVKNQSPWMRRIRRQQIDGAEYWRSASIASQYTGRYGTDLLVGMIRGLITKSNKAVTV